MSTSKCKRRETTERSKNSERSKKTQENDRKNPAKQYQNEHNFRLCFRSGPAFGLLDQGLQSESDSDPTGEKKFVSRNAISWSQGFSGGLEVLHGSLRIL
jgi:hypothetical protein